MGIILICGCSTIKYGEMVLGTDFSKSVSEGIKIYPEGTSLKQSYTPMSSVSCVFRIGELPRGRKDMEKNGDIYEGYTGSKSFCPSGTYMFDRFLEVVKTYENADAVINYRAVYDYDKNNIHIGYTISGIIVSID